MAVPRSSTNPPQRARKTMPAIWSRMEVLGFDSEPAARKDPEAVGS